MCAKCKFHDNTFVGLNLNNAPLSCKLMYSEFLQTEEPYELDFLCPNQLKNRFIRTLWELMDKSFFERLRVDISYRLNPGFLFSSTFKTMLLTKAHLDRKWLSLRTIPLTTKPERPTKTVSRSLRPTSTHL